MGMHRFQSPVLVSMGTAARFSLRHEQPCAISPHLCAMNVLILGGGGREHALAKKISESPLCTSLYIGPGNPGTAEYGRNIDLNILDAESVAQALDRYSIDLIVVGPEQPLVEGLRDSLEQLSALKSRIFFGPGALGAKLEGSKGFAKDFMQRHGIPTAGAHIFNSTELEGALAHLQNQRAPYVLKADGLAAGKGVIITSDRAEAEREIRELLGGRFGEASKTVLIEDFLSGREFSVFALTDGQRFLILPEARDYKRVGEGDTGPNTGGMGSVSPVEYVDDLMRNKVLERIVKPTIEGLAKEKIDYLGFVFFGLIEVEGEPFVIEYNVRMGDPETQSVMLRLESDLLEHILELGKGEPLSPVHFSDRAAATVVLCSEGYPLSARKGDPIEGTESVGSVEVFHSGTKREGEGPLLSWGGRVLSVSALAEDLPRALKQCYEAVGHIRFEGMHYRKDIGR